MEIRHNNGYISFSPCPRCKGEDLEFEKKNNEVTCRRCGLTVTKPFVPDLLRTWNTPKEERVKYVIRNIVRYGNAYVGAFTKSLWDKEELASYLREQTGVDVTVSEPTEVEEGLVVKEVKARKEVA